MTMTLRKRRRRTRPPVSEGAEHDFEKVHFALPLNDDDSSMPKLRRAGSSVEDSLGSIHSDNNYPVGTSKEKAFILQTIINTISIQVKGLSNDFCQNGLPWKGPQCRSVVAGCSGVFYMLPIFATSNSLERFQWILQACLSVLADYFHIHHDSAWHGIDRYFATFNVVLILYRAYKRLHWSILSLAIAPLGSYVFASRAKTMLDIQSWHWYHFGWHITGSVAVTCVVYLIHHCRNEVDPLLMAFCGS